LSPEDRETDACAVVILRNSAQHLAGLLPSILASRRVTRVVLFDNASEDLSHVKQLVEAAADPRLQLIESPSNIGFGAGINAAVASAGGRQPILLLLNPDLTASADSLDAVVSAAAAQKAVVGAVTLWSSAGPMCRRQTKAGNALSDFWPRFLPSTPKGMARWAQQSGPEVDWVEFSLVAMPLDVFERIGRFDPSYFLYSEDEDLCRRARVAGIPVVQIDVGQIVHERGGSSTSDYGFARMHYHASMVRQLSQWESKGAACVYTVAFACYYGVYALRHPNRRRPNIRGSLHLMRAGIGGM
jgi:N-acetylglucosaminyl-diphospho-decaprenol L-rhamnosyltransferase